MKKGKIYIFGHRNPDTDSVTSAIALSYLKNKLGLKTIPAVLGTPNLETKYALKYFKVKQPEILDDVKIKVKDLNYIKGYSVTEEDSIDTAYQKMLEVGISKIPVVDDNKKMLGILTMKDIAEEQFSNNLDLVNTTYDDILKTIDGEEVLRFDDNIEGKLLVASYKSKTIKEDVELTDKDILMVGDRHNIIKYAIKSGVKLLIITGPKNIHEWHITLAKKNKVNIINTSHHTIITARKFSLANKVKTLNYEKNLVSVNENVNVTEFIRLSNKTRYSYYPVVNDKEECVGVLRVSDVAYDKKQKVMLVDHNTYEQSARGIEEAEILEIIDHHNIGSIGTNMPISFRNMPVGSTNTILNILYKESDVEIPKHIAGLMLSGILSDTLILKSPTTTVYDIDAVQELSKIAEVDYREYGLKMLKAGSSLKGKTKEEVLYTDYKTYQISDEKIGLGQLSTTNPKEILDDIDQYVKLINNVTTANNYLLVALFITDILNNGSYVIYSINGEYILKDAFNLKTIKQGLFLKGIISRKKQILPKIMDKIKNG